MPPASLGSIFMISVFVVAAASVLILVAVRAAARSVASVALAATFLVFLVLLTVAFLFLVEASGNLFKPGVRYTVCAVHDTAQDELFHLGLLVCVVCLVRSCDCSVACLCLTIW